MWIAVFTGDVIALDPAGRCASRDAVGQDEARQRTVRGFAGVGEQALRTPGIHVIEKSRQVCVI